MKHRYPSAKLNRKYAIILYIASLIMFLTAMYECIYIGVYFHIPLFALFVISFSMGLYCALKYKFALELRILYVNIIVIIFCMLANIIFVTGVGSVNNLVRTIFLLALMLIGLSYRLELIKWLTESAVQMQKGEK